MKFECWDENAKPANDAENQVMKALKRVDSKKIVKR
jgi:hypothetical protein